MADLKFLGRILGVIGGLIMLIVAIVVGVNNFLEEVLLELPDIVSINAVESFLGAQNWIVYVLVMAICGIIAIYGYQQLATKAKGDLLIWGIIYIVLGLVGGSLGGLLVLLGGIVLVLDQFI